MGGLSVVSLLYDLCLGIAFPFVNANLSSGNFFHGQSKAKITEYLAAIEQAVFRILQIKKWTKKISFLGTGAF